MARTSLHRKAIRKGERQVWKPRFADAFKAEGLRYNPAALWTGGYNQKLSERRAASVKAEMVRLGVPSDVIMTEGRGFSEPLVPTGPGVKEPQNRRAVIELQ